MRHLRAGKRVRRLEPRGRSTIDRLTEMNERPEHEVQQIEGGPRPNVPPNDALAREEDLGCPLLAAHTAGWSEPKEPQKRSVHKAREVEDQRWIEPWQRGEEVA